MTQSTSSQRKRLYRSFGYCKETEALHVKTVTQNKFETAKGLSIHQADVLLKKLATNWASFDKDNKQHMYVLSLLQQLGWSKTHVRFGTIADLPRLSNFLKSKKSPVPKPLQEMEPDEVSKLISCLDSMLMKSVSK